MTRSLPTGSDEPPVAFDPSSGRLRRGSHVITLRPKDALVLQALAAGQGRLVTKPALITAAWSNVWVTDAVVKAAVNRLRGALDDDATSPRYIQTVHRRGYRFIGHLEPDSLIADVTTPSLLSPLPPPIVGRAAEIAQLDRAFADAAAGTHRVVFVSGEAGYGKTALLELFLRTRVPVGALVGRGQCVERYGAGEAFMPLFAVLRGLCETAGAGITSRLAAQAPEWLGQMPGLLDAGAAEGVRQRGSGVTRDRMHREFVDAVVWLSRERPVVIAIEDLHWSDASTLDVIALLARRPDPARVLVVGTYRPEEVLPRGHPLHAFTKALRVQRASTEVSLPLLTLQFVDAYLAVRFAGAEVPRDFVRAIHERTEGHPLFLAGLADEWTAHDWFVEDGHGCWRRSADLEDLTLTVPDDFKQMVEMRLERLQAAERRAIESASVCGPVFSAASVAAALQSDLVRADERCAAIARRHLLIRADGEEIWADGTRSGRYRFAHALYRDCAYERVPAARRQQMHRRIALREEAGFGTRAAAIAARLAMHFEAASDAGHALQYRTIAARNAAGVAGFGEAIGHAMAALETLGSLPGAAPNEELALQLVLGGSRAATEGFAAASAEHAYARARELSLQASDSIESIQAMAGLFAYHLMRGPVDVTGEIGRRLLECAERTGHAEAVAWGRMATGVQRLQCGEMTAAGEDFAAVLSLYDAGRRHAYLAIHAVDPHTAALGYSSWAFWMLGFPSRAVEHGRAAVAFAEQAGHPLDIAHAFVLQAHLHQFCQDPGATRASAQAAIKWSEEYGLGQYLWPAKAIHGWSRAVNGDVSGGLAELRQAMEVWSGSGAQFAVPRHFALLGELQLAAGDLPAAEQALNSALAAARASGERFWEPETHRLLGMLHLRRSQTSAGSDRDRALGDAMGAVERAITLAHAQGARSLELRATVSLCQVGDACGPDAVPRQRLSELCDAFHAEGRDHADWRAANAWLRA